MFSRQIPNKYPRYLETGAKGEDGDSTLEEQNKLNFEHVTLAPEPTVLLGVFSR